MNRSLVGLTLLALIGAAVQFAQEPVAGVPARHNADDYAVKAPVGKASIAASLIPAKQVRDMFAYNISDSYVVFEVACYVDSSAPLQIQRDDFVIKGRSQGELMHQVEAETIASVIQQKNMPKPPSRKPDVGVGAAVGYESGIDPVTGRKVHGVYTDASVGVGIGSDGRYPIPSGGIPVDRDVLQAQLKARSLPEGKLDHAVAGYLFFPRAGLQRQADGKYALEYLMDKNEVLLSVPGKTR